MYLAQLNRFMGGGFLANHYTCAAQRNTMDDVSRRTLNALHAAP